MSFTYDPTTDVGRVRRTIPDRSEDEAIWSDEEIQSFLDDCSNNWRRATAIILETMAADNLLVLKVIRVQNIETDASKMVTALMQRAKRLRDDADEVAANNADDSFDFAEVVNNEHQWKERIYNQALRGAI